MCERCFSDPPPTPSPFTAPTGMSGRPYHLLISSTVPADAFECVDETVARISHSPASASLCSTAIAPTSS